MGLRTGLVLLAMLWAVSARPQRESTGGTAGEAPGAPPPEGFQALINRISVRLMCAGKDVPDCESMASTCLTEYGLGSDGELDFETACQGKNQLLCYTKISECVELLSVAPSAGQLLVSEVCTGKMTEECAQDTAECMSLLSPGPGGSSGCSPSSSPTDTATDTPCTANVRKCIELLLPEEGTEAARPPVTEITAVVPSSATVRTPAEELAALTQTAIATTACQASDLPNCQTQLKECFTFFGFSTTSSTTSPDLDAICGGAVTPQCLQTVATCSELLPQAASTTPELPVVLCSRMSVPNCHFKTVKCLALSGPEPDLSFCADDSSCEPEVADCVEHFQQSLSALVPETSQSTVSSVSQSPVPGVSESPVPTETESPVSEESHSTDPLGFIAEITNSILVFLLCAGKGNEQPNCHKDVEECMFNLRIPPPGFGPPVDNETLCEPGLDAETCAKKQNCLFLYTPKPNATDLLPQDLCRTRNVSNCEERAVLCLEVSGLAGLSKLLTGVPDEFPEDARSPSQAPGIFGPGEALLKPTGPSEETFPEPLGSSPSSRPVAVPEDFDQTTCLEVLSPRPLSSSGPTTTTTDPASTSTRGPTSTTTRPPRSTTRNPPGSTTTNPPTSTSSRGPGSTTTGPPPASTSSRGPGSTTTGPPASTSSSSTRDRATPKTTGEPATPKPTRESTQDRFPDVVEEEEETPGAEILCPKGGLECLRKAEECLEKLKPDRYFLREFFSCKAEVGRRMKDCMKPAMETLLQNVAPRGLQTPMLEAFPICFEENDFEGIRLCEAKTCMEVEAS
nr:mucin-5AC-like isoform X1 [Penaeus vannamei]